MTKHMQAYMYVHMYRVVLVFINMSVTQKHECVYIHSMYNAYVRVYQYLFFSIYVHYLLFLISIQCTKCFMNLKSITKKHIKQCIRSSS